MKVRTLILLILLTAISTSCSETESQENSDKKDIATKEKPARPATPVEVVKLGNGDIGSYILLNSTIDTEQMIDVYSQASGFVDKILQEEGAFVKAGDPLFRLDARELELRRDRAVATFDKRTREYNRFKENAKLSVLSKEEVENIKYQYDLARIDMQEAKLALEYATIKSPINGVVSQRNIDIGDRVDQGKKVYTVTNIEELITIVNVPEREMGRVKKGQLVKLFSDNIKDPQGSVITFIARVKRVAPVINPLSGTYKVTVAVTPDRKLYAGAFINVHIQTDLRKNSLLIPKSALVYENEEKYVFAVRDSIVEKINIMPGYEDSYFVETQSSKLATGDSIVLLGKDGLKNATKVKVVKQESVSNVVAKK